MTLTEELYNVKQINIPVSNLPEFPSTSTARLYFINNPQSIKLSTKSKTNDIAVTT